MNILKLEQKIMQAWQTSSDVDLLYFQFLDGPKMDEDDVANALLGINVLHEMRMNQLWNEFECLCEEIRREKCVKQKSIV